MRIRYRAAWRLRVFLLLQERRWTSAVDQTPLIRPGSQINLTMPGEKSIPGEQTHTEPHELMLRLLLIGQVLISIETRVSLTESFHRFTMNR